MSKRAELEAAFDVEAAKFTEEYESVYRPELGDNHWARSLEELDDLYLMLTRTKAALRALREEVAKHGRDA
jgi:hypothetical protein